MMLEEQASSKSHLLSMKEQITSNYQALQERNRFLERIVEKSQLTKQSMEVSVKTSSEIIKKDRDAQFFSQVEEQLKNSEKLFKRKVNKKEEYQRLDVYSKLSMGNFEGLEESSKGFGLDKLAYTMPSFSLFFYSKIKKYQETLPEERQEAISPMFFATLRAILDAKYNEFLLHSDSRQYTKFSPFVFSWLGKFTICPKRRVVALLDTNDPAETDHARIDFFMNLYHMSVSNLWEVVTFKEFLEGIGSLDEIYYYLHLRYMLFEGNQMETTKATFDIIQYVPFEKVEKILKLSFEKYNEGHYTFIMAKVREKTRTEKKGALAKGKEKQSNTVDATFVLRILLEYYRAERLHRYKLIKNVWVLKSLPNDRTSFEAFRKIVDVTFPKITELEKAELYCECYNVGDGIITPDIYFTVVSERNLFVNSLNLRTSLGFPVGLKQDFEIDPKHPLAKACLQVFGKINDIAPFIKQVDSILISSGSEQLLHEWNYYFKLIKDKFQVNGLRISDKNIFGVYSHIFSICFRVFEIPLTSSIFKGNYKQEEAISAITSYFDILSQLMKDFYSIESFRKKNCLKKFLFLQKFLRKKFDTQMLLNKVVEDPE